MTTENKLAIDGGTPVRDTAKRPWPVWPQVSEEQWTTRVEPALRKVYLSASEGLPMSVAQQFAARFARMHGVRFARMLVHGTDALAAALSAALDLHICDDAGEIIVPNYTYIASASAPLDRRFRVCFVDVDPETLTIDPAALDAAVRPGRTTAVMPVHLLGHPADMDAVNAVARKHNLIVVEDCAQAHGAKYKGRGVGGLGHAGAFSFQSSKNLTAGEGGLVTTNDEEIDNRVAAFMNCGRHPRGGRWEYPRIGWNYRPSEYVAALLSVRLDDLEAQAEHRSRMAAALNRGLAGLPGIHTPVEADGCTRHAYHMYCMQIDTGQFGGRSRNDVVAALQAEGIPCTEGYTTPLSDQPGMLKLAAKHPDVVRVEDCPNTRRVCSRSIWLYQYLLLTGERDMQDIVEALAKIQRAFA